MSQTEEIVEHEDRDVSAKYDAAKKQAVASTAVVDRQGETIDQKGWDLKNFKDNPVMLWAHDHTIPAIGTAENVRVSKAGGEARLVFEPKFNEATEFAKAIKFLYEGDEDNAPVLNSFSVGFRPLDMDGNAITKQELYEISAVNVPANPEARMLAYKSLRTAGFKKKTIAEIGIEGEFFTEVVDKVVSLEKDVSELRGKIESFQKVKEVPKPERRAANERLSMLKVIVRASDKILEGEKKHLPKPQRVDLTKVIKRAAEKVIVEDLKKVR